MKKSFNIGRTLPLDVGIIHLVGIGGIGMSGIAEILHNMGYHVQGSDVAESANVQRLRAMGVEVMVGHKPENIANASVVVKSTAVDWENPEITAAREAGIPVLRRSEMLAELTRLKMTIAISGTHGKTTTTSLVSALLATGGMDPTVLNGGILNAIGTNAYLGKGEWMVVEADESDGTFIKIPASVAVVTNIDPEHLDHWGSFDAVRQAFTQLIMNLPFYGFAVICIDHPEVQALKARVHDRRVITYGFSPQADVRAVNVQPDADGTTFDVVISDRMGLTARTIEGVRIQIRGEHNVLNSLAAMGVAMNLGISDAKMKEGLAGFQGVKRRFTKTGAVNGITVIDDYGHHPVEIAATLKAARQAVSGSPTSGTTGRVLAVVQPHRFTRVRDLLPQFASCLHDADAVWITDIYTAGEQPIEGINRTSLAQAIRQNGHKDVRELQSPDDLAGEILGMAKPGDYVICLGAGSISAWAHALPQQMEALLNQTDAQKV
ncbi:UDP-N-acetylmuramate--L-alanine ligase [bacterium]|nr:UDP-N-acetylmuramate--L-alanine ligase [bacterium]